MEIKMKLKDKKDAIPIVCPTCSHKWKFRGNRKIYATCPDCKSSVRLS